MLKIHDILLVIYLINTHLCLSVESSGWEITRQLPKNGELPIRVIDKCEFYEIKKIKNIRPPSVIELLEYIFSREKISFSIGNKDFNIFPLDRFEVIKNGKKRIFGYFDKVSSNGKGLVLKYTNGDKTVYGKRYSSIIKITYGSEPTYKALFSAIPDKNIFEIELNDPIKSFERKHIAVVCDKPTIGGYITKLTDQKLKEPKITAILNILGFDQSFILRDNQLFKNGILNLKMLKDLGKRMRKQHSNTANKETSINDSLHLDQNKPDSNIATENTANTETSINDSLPLDQNKPDSNIATENTANKETSINDSFPLDQNKPDSNIATDKENNNVTEEHSVPNSKTINETPSNSKPEESNDTVSDTNEIKEEQTEENEIIS